MSSRVNYIDPSDDVLGFITHQLVPIGTGMALVRKRGAPPKASEPYDPFAEVKQELRSLVSRKESAPPYVGELAQIALRRLAACEASVLQFPEEHQDKVRSILIGAWQAGRHEASAIFRDRGFEVTQVAKKFERDRSRAGGQKSLLRNPKSNELLRFKRMDELCEEAKAANQRPIIEKVAASVLHEHFRTGDFDHEPTEKDVTNLARRFSNHIRKYGKLTIEDIDSKVR